MGVLVLLAPVAGGEGVLEGVADLTVGLHEGGLDVDALLLLDLPTEDILALLLELVELTSEYLSQKAPHHVQSLLPVVVSIVLSRSTQSSLSDSIHHVSQEIRLLRIVMLSQMRQQLLGQNLFRPQSSLLFPHGVHLVRPLRDQIQSYINFVDAICFFQRRP